MTRLWQANQDHRRARRRGGPDRPRIPGWIGATPRSAGITPTLLRRSRPAPRAITQRPRCAPQNVRVRSWLADAQTGEALEDLDDGREVDLGVAAADRGDQRIARRGRRGEGHAGGLRLLQ